MMYIKKLKYFLFMSKKQNQLSSRAVTAQHQKQNQLSPRVATAKNQKQRSKSSAATAQNQKRPQINEANIPKIKYDSNVQPLTLKDLNQSLSNFAGNVANQIKDINLKISSLEKMEDSIVSRMQRLIQETIAQSIMTMQDSIAQSMMTMQNSITSQVHSQLEKEYSKEKEFITEFSQAVVRIGSKYLDQEQSANENNNNQNANENNNQNISS